MDKMFWRCAWDIFTRLIRKIMARLSQILKGMQGDEGKTPELRAGDTHIQWRYANQTPEDTWQDLIAISELTGDAIEIQKGELAIQWRYADQDPEDTWKDIVTLTEITGTEGLSAYEVWLLEGNEGTEQDFLNSLGGSSIVFKRSATALTKPANTGYNVPEGGWARSVEIAGIDRTEVADGISRAVSGDVGDEALFITAEAETGRPLADVNDSGAVNTTDAFNYAQHTNGSTYIPYIEDVMHPYMVANKVDYAAYFDDTEDLYMCVGRNDGTEWVWDTPINLDAGGGADQFNIDGGTADSVYTLEQTIDGGTA